jgi:Mg-chelatase subunit ChlD
VEFTEAAPPDLLLVVDKSGSMRDPLATGENKWNTMRGAINQVVADYETGINFGLMTYPSDDQCATGQVRADIGANATSISGVLNSTFANGGTPTHHTLAVALNYYQGVAVNPEGRYVLLATDGLPNCDNLVDPLQPTVTQSIAAIQNLSNAGISTFVLGFGGAINNDPTTLQAMAAAGGTGNYYPANSPAELQAALDAIAGEVGVAACTFNLNETPDDPGELSVSFDTNDIPRDVSHNNGWDYDAATNSITMYGDACDQIQAGNVGEVQVDYGCGGGPVVIVD